MKTLALNIRERLVGLSVFNNPENKVATSELKGYLEDASKFNITEEDRQAVKWEDILAEEDILNKDGQVIAKKGNVISFKFDESGVEPKSIELSDFSVKYLLEKLESLEYSAADQLALSIISIIEKLKA